jgi:DNA-binding transcriptional LysR family regulator
MQLKDLQAFAHIAEHGNLHAAADTMGLTQPALSKALRRLETELGVRLLERLPRGVALTAAGRLLHERSRSLTRLVDDTRMEIADLKTGQSGQLRVGAVPTILDSKLGPVLAKLLGGEEPLRFFVSVQLSGGLLRALQAGELDFALAAIPKPVPDELSCLPLWRQETHIVARKGHWLQHSPCTLEQLSQQAWLLPPRGIMTRTWVEALFAQAGLDKPRVVVEADAPQGLLATLMRKSDLLSAMTVDTLASPMGAGLAALSAAQGPWVTPLGLFWRRAAYFSRPMERCRDRLLASLSDPPSA